MSVSFLKHLSSPSVTWEGRVVRHLPALLLLAFATTGLNSCQNVRDLLVRRPGELMPCYRPVSEVQFADQNWSASQRHWFYHAGQGTMLVPYKWFMALEQPSIHIFGRVPPFHDTEYLARFGFLPDEAGPQNPGCLPVGFANDRVTDPHTGESLDVVGLTCAACHTGQLEHAGEGIRIDGGSATVDLAAFQTELAYAIGYTAKAPFRFDRFAKAVLGEHASDESKGSLRQQFDSFLQQGLNEKEAADRGNLYAAYGGFGRTDALGRIGNFVFGTELDNQNLRVADAPVSFPPLWYASWFDWVQYNGSIQQPMGRNIGEALGVRARVNLTDSKAGLYRSTVDVKNLHDIERLLSGPTPFSGLKAPVWPEQTLGSIDRQKAQKGELLFRQYCQRCHLSPLSSSEIQDVSSQHWVPGQQGHKFLRINLIPLEKIGTDPRAAKDFAERSAVAGGLGLGTVSAADGLRAVTEHVEDRAYDDLGIVADRRPEWNGFREGGVRAPLAYKARPLEGIWATPPFLHNGSVPNLYQLLLPADRRDKTFYVGSREFDPKYVGFHTEKFEGSFEFRTDQPGNFNRGHEFRDAPEGNGVIGPELTDDERWAIIEYLKIL